MYVLGTAGHVDHGKSALVRAMTGIDPDRLPEEKQRGMTIDLGFAWLKLPSGKEVSIVDVPGHERFIRNMLAGAGGIDVALLVVAADEGVMPQTREHLAILDLLHVKSGIVVITKKDLVDREWLELVTSDIQGLLKGTTLDGCSIHAVSSVTGEGIQQLVAAIDKLLEAVPPKKDIGKPRLPIDRVFTVSGFGTVVTGTLIDGSLEVGQEVEVLPQGLATRIRGLQTHNQKEEKVGPGNRVAANLGGVALDQVQRGNVVTTPGWLKPTVALDARLRLLPDAPQPLHHNREVSFHTGAAEVMARVRLLEGDELKPGQSAWAQIRLESASGGLAVARGDAFVIRAGGFTVGGGEVVEPHAKRHRRRATAVLEELSALEKGSPDQMLLTVLAQKEPAEFKSLVEQSNLPVARVAELVKSLVHGKQAVMLGGDGEPKPGSLLFTSTGWAALVSKVKQAVESYHKQYPLRSGMPREELKSRLKLSPRLFADALPRAVMEKALIEEQSVLKLPDWQPRLTPVQKKAADAFLAALQKNPYSPATELNPDPELLNYLVEQGQVAKVSEGVVFASTAYKEMADRIVAHLKANGKITVAEVRDMFSTSRKFALALMEHLDERKVTRRVGDERVLR